MTAEQLVYRQVTMAVCGDDPAGSLLKLEGTLYDIASSAWDSSRSALQQGLEELAAEFMENWRDVSALAGYAGRVADTFEIAKVA